MTIEAHLISEGYTLENVKRFQAFHKKNQWIWESFKQRAFLAGKRGKKRIAAKMIIENIRWNEEVEKKKGRKFRINNNYTSMYARSFMYIYPKYSDLFELREVKGLKLTDYTEPTERNVKDFL